MNEGTRCKNHPRRQAAVHHNGWNFGLCKKCLNARAQKGGAANRENWEKRNKFNGITRPCLKCGQMFKQTAKRRFICEKCFNLNSNCADIGGRISLGVSDVSAYL